MHHTAPTIKDPYGNYNDGVIVNPAEVHLHNDGNIWVYDEGRWANCHPPHANLLGYGVRWFASDFEVNDRHLMTNAQICADDLSNDEAFNKILANFN